MKKGIIKVCHGHKCKAQFSECISDRLKADLEKGKNENIKVETMMCQGKCMTAPNVIIEENNNTKNIPHASPVQMAKMIKK